MPINSFGAVIPVTGPNIGFPGGFSRTGERTVAARQVLSTTATNLPFGAPAVIVSDSAGGTYQSVADFISGGGNSMQAIQQFAGIAVRNVKTMLTYPNNVTPGSVRQVGYFAAGEEGEVMERGSVTVLITNGTPASQSQVYVRMVANGGLTATSVGDLEAGADQAASTTATLTANGSTISVASGTGIAVGQMVSGFGIQPNTCVTAVSGTTITLSLNTMFAGTGVAVLFNNCAVLPGVVFRTGYQDANGLAEITLKSRPAA